MLWDDGDAWLRSSCIMMKMNILVENKPRTPKAERTCDESCLLSLLPKLL